MIAICLHSPEALDRIADQEGLSRSEMIRAAVRKVWLKTKNG